MIYIDGKPLDPAAITEQFPGGGLEKDIFEKMISADEKFAYDSLEALKFELRLRREIVQASKALNKSGMAFEVFRDSKANPQYWTRGHDGGFALKPGVKASDAIRDIFNNGSKYGTECATAMQIVYYKALLEIFPESDFNRMFGDIYLMNWHNLSRELRSTGLMHPETVFLPGDRRYFKNPDVNPKTPEWQGENVIELGDGRYYGHGIGIHRAETIIDALNDNRRRNADREAYLMDSAGRPDYKRLATLYERAVTAGSQTAQRA